MKKLLGKEYLAYLQTSSVISSEILINQSLNQSSISVQFRPSIEKMDILV